MADNGQIDNVYVNFEVKDNGADDKIAKIDEALEKLIATLERIDDKLTGFKDDFKSIESAVGNIKLPKLDTTETEKSVDEIINKTKQLQNLPTNINYGAFDGLANSIKNTSNNLKSLQVTTFDIDDLIYKGHLATQQFNKLNYAIYRLHSAGILIEKIGKSIGKAFIKTTKIITNLFKKISKGGSSFNKSYGGLRGLLGTAKRFLVFGTFFTIQRQISQAFSEGTQNLYQFSKAIDGKFAQSMDRLATSFLYLKNAIGAAVAPIINAFTPALESLIDTVAEFGNKLAETFAALTGATTFKKAIKWHKEYAEAVNKTNNALAKFDEINNITTSKSNDELDYGSLFVIEEVNIGGWLKAIIENIKKGNWNKVGQTIAEKLNSQFEKISKTKVGTNLGLKVNSILDFGLGFVKNFEWSKNSDILFTEFEKFLIGVNWVGLGDLLGTTVQGLLDVIYVGIEKFNPKKAADTLFTVLTKFLDKIKFDKLGEKLSELIKKFLNFVTRWIENIDTPQNRSKAQKRMTDFVNSIDWKGIGKAIADLIWAGFKYKLKKVAENLTIGDFSYADVILSGYRKQTTGWGGAGKGFANGGYPESGQMFIARENGIPEMVGSIGGRTAVANNDQIVEAISIGVYNAYMDAMSRSGGNKQPTIIQISGREVFRAVQDESTSYTKRTGQPAF